ncbi:MAG: DUF362 domain-containing protein [Desulfobacterales bacterium]|nr:DUF362 domain-containing protein [Desulfobacterales bacterium]
MHVLREHKIASHKITSDKNPRQKEGQIVMITRRQFMIAAAGGIVWVVAGGSGERAAMAKQLNVAQKGRKTKVSLVKTSDRESGTKKAVELLGMNPVKGKDVLLKPNFNTADPFPGSTHNDTLTHLILQLKNMGAKSITIGERSGPPDTASVLKQKRIYDLSKKLGVGLINFEELPPNGWIRVKPEKSHWRDGFDVAKPILDSKCVVTTCCLKTHKYGGVFTMSLKLSVGITHKRDMGELHTSFFSMRKMIAEINQVYTPSLILLDGIEAFVDGGPMEGPKKRGNVMIAGTDRIAIDAVGLAILKELGSNKHIMGKKIFEQEQIARAIELGLGITGPQEIEIIADDSESKKYVERLAGILLNG